MNWQIREKKTKAELPASLKYMDFNKIKSDVLKEIKASLSHVQIDIQFETDFLYFNVAEPFISDKSSRRLWVRKRITYVTLEPKSPVEIVQLFKEEVVKLRTLVHERYYGERDKAIEMVLL